MAEGQNPGFEYDQFAPQTGGRLFTNAMFGFNKEEVLEYLDELADENIQRQEAADVQLQELKQRISALEESLAKAQEAPALQMGDGQVFEALNFDAQQFEADQQLLVQLTEEVDIAKMATQQAEEDLAEARERLFNAQQEAEWLRGENQKTDTQVSELQKRLDDVLSGQWVAPSAQQQQEENDRLLAENQRLIAENQQKSAEAETLYEENLSVKSEKESLEAESNLQMADQQKLQEEINRLFAENMRLMAEIELFASQKEQDLADSQSSFAQQSQNFAQLNLQISQLEAELESAQMLCQNKDLQLAKTNEELLQAKNSQGENQAGLLSARLQLADNARTLAALQEEAEMAKKDLQNAKIDAEEQQNNLFVLHQENQQKLDDAQKCLAQAQRQLEDSLQNAKRREEELETQLLQYAKAGTENEQSLAELAKLLDETTLQRENLLEKAQKMQAELDERVKVDKEKQAEFDLLLGNNQEQLAQSRQKAQENEDIVFALQAKIAQVEAELEEERSADHSGTVSAAIIAGANAEAERIRAMAMDEKERIRRQIGSSVGGLSTSIANLRGDVEGVEVGVTSVLSAVQTSLADILSALSRTEQNLNTVDVQVERFPAASASVPKAPHQQIVYFQPSALPEAAGGKTAKNRPLPPESYGQGGFRRVWADETKADTAPPQAFRPSHTTSPAAQAAPAFWPLPDEVSSQNPKELRVRALAENLMDTLREMME